jgi:hypothetical protein
VNNSEYRVDYVRSEVRIRGTLFTSFKPLRCIGVTSLNPQVKFGQGVVHSSDHPFIAYFVEHDWHFCWVHK